MPSKRTLIALVSLIVAVACSPVPDPFPLTGQAVVGGASRWESMAQHAAEQIEGCLQGRDYQVHWWDDEVRKPYCFTDVSGLSGVPIYVELVDSAMPFARAFHDFLTTELLDIDLSVTLDPTDALIVRTRVQFVDRNKAASMDPVPGFFTLLTTSIWAFEVTNLPRMVGIGALTDLVSSSSKYGKAQVIVTITLTDGDQIVTQTAEAYYIKDVDAAQFASGAPVADLLSPRKSGAEPPPVRTFDIVAD